MLGFIGSSKATVGNRCWLDAKPQYEGKPLSLCPGEMPANNAVSVNFLIKE